MFCFAFPPFFMFIASWLSSPHTADGWEAFDEHEQVKYFRKPYAAQKSASNAASGDADESSENDTVALKGAVFLCSLCQLCHCF